MRTLAPIDAERRRYRDLFETAPEAHFVTSQSAVIQEANTAAADLLGVPSRDLVGKSLAAFIEKGDRRIFRIALRRLEELARINDLEVRIRVRTKTEPAQDSILYGVMSARVVPNADGVVHWIVRDGTELRRAHALVASLRAQLRAGASVREQALAAALEDAKRARIAAEEGARARDEFVAALSHELRTPLNAVLGWLRLVHVKASDEAARLRALDIIERNARAQAKLLEDLLDMSRVVLGKLEIEWTSLDFGEIAVRAASTIAPIAAEKRITLDVSMDPGPCPVQGDAARLQQVLLNLLSNAVKFTPTGGKVCLRLATSGGVARLSVIDTGPGIPADVLPHVFDRFRQAPMGRHAGGLGLGLWIVRSIVHLHGGEVWAESSAAGATFTVALPLERANPQATAPPGVRPPPATALAGRDDAAPPDPAVQGSSRAGTRPAPARGRTFTDCRRPTA